jgi:hypothetical protein
MLDTIRKSIADSKEHTKKLDEFVAEVERMAAVGEFPDCSSDTVCEGERIIAEISDPQLKALVTVCNRRHDAMIELLEGAASALSTEKREFLLSEIHKEAEIAQLLRELMWEELRVVFGATDVPRIGIRSGWKLVRAETQFSTGRGIPVEVLMGIIGLSEDCGDPRCQIHHPETVAQR